MNHTLAVSESVIIQASPARVWEVLTTPALIAEYLFGTQAVTDWKPGSPIVFQGSHGGHAYRDHGVIKEIVSPSRLVYTYWSGFSGLADEPGNYALITYTVEPLPDGTRFTWDQQGYPSEERRQHSQSGMKDFLAQIKGLAERSA